MENGRPQINMDVARCIMTLTEERLNTDEDADAGTRVAWMMLQLEGMRGDSLQAGGGGTTTRICDHDGIVEPNQGEKCDDGNMNNNDSCKNNCTPRIDDDGENTKPCCSVSGTTLITTGRCDPTC